MPGLSYMKDLCNPDFLNYKKHLRLSELDKRHYGTTDVKKAQWISETPNSRKQSRKMNFTTYSGFSATKACQ